MMLERAPGGRLYSASVKAEARRRISGKVLLRLSNSQASMSPSSSNGNEVGVCNGKWCS